MIHAIDYQGGQIFGVLPPDIKDGEEILYKNGDTYHFAAYSKHYDKYDWCIKVVAQSPNLSLEGIPYVEIEEDVDKLAWEWCDDDREVGAFKAGYKAASAKRYSEDDLRKAFEAGKNRQYWEEDYKEGHHVLEGNAPNIEKYLQLLQPKVVSIEVEMEYLPDGTHISNAKEGDYVMNSHGCKGIINYLTDDIRVEIGDFIEISQTGDNGLDTLEINGYKICKLTPVAYTKDGKTFLKVKSVQYE